MFKARDLPAVKELGLELKMQLCCRVWLMAALVLHLCCIGQGGEPQAPALIVFGDSTVDVGTNSYLKTLVKSDFAPYGESFEGGKPTGRFTNGLMVNDFLGKMLRCSSCSLQGTFLLLFHWEAHPLVAGCIDQNQL